MKPFMKHISSKFWQCAVTSLLAVLSSAAHAGLEWVQIGRVSGDVVCGSLETGIGDSRDLRFHRYNKFMSGSSVNERILVQRGSTIAVRLLGHAADVFPSVQEEITGVAASVTGQGRYFHQPNANVGPLGFVEVRIKVRDNAELGNNSVFVQWPTGRERIPLKIVRDCDQTRAAPVTRVPDSQCFGAGGSNCGAPLGPFNPLAVCSSGLCLYSGGSWTHDECCARNSAGYACGGLDSFVSGENSCRPEFDKAVSRATSGFNWHRETDFSKTNTSGRVVAADACAPRGTIVHSDDERFCCARQGINRNPSEAERNKSNVNPMVKGYATAGVARANIPPGAVACE